jgi:hypothetical protein
VRSRGEEGLFCGDVFQSAQSDRLEGISSAVALAVQIMKLFISNLREETEMSEKIYKEAAELLGPETKLGDLYKSGHGPRGTETGSWALGWSHYFAAGDAHTAPELDDKGYLDIKGTKIGPESTVAELFSAIQK